MSPAEDLEAQALEVGLRYVTDDLPGIGRLRRGRGFSYRLPSGETLTDGRVRRRIESHAIPPAWTDVWISPLASGHLQATGRDDLERKQYRYHPLWRKLRDDRKFHRMRSFGQRLPHLRAAVDRDLRRRTLTRERVVAAVVRLLETSCIRIGNEEYRRNHGTYGLTTMRKRHVELAGANSIRFQFVGKGGQRQTVRVEDPRTARVVRRLQELPGQELFHYEGEEGELERVDSDDVNEYIHRHAGSRYTAKDFRTWMGTLQALLALAEVDVGESAGERSRLIVQAVDRVAENLRNTRAVCRASYIHPDLLELYEEGLLLDIADLASSQPSAWLDAEEVALMRVLHHLDEAS
ncbi:MAG TPA: DNA topoisomerase IB [Thermoanaerobaculia bacterium]|nr:DNA topoisomerase IB [Thermoanaerobaculia bacterium]